MYGTSSRSGRSAKIIWIVILILIVLIGGKYVFDFFFPYECENYIEPTAEKYEVDPVLIYSMCNAGSNFKKNIETTEDAQGVMQVSYQTLEDLYKEFGISKEKNISDPQNNIEYGTKIMAYLLKRYNGDEFTALAAFKAGTVAVDGWLGDSIYSKDGKALQSTPYDKVTQYCKKTILNKKVYSVLMKIHHIGDKEEEEASSVA